MKTYKSNSYLTVDAKPVILEDGLQLSCNDNTVVVEYDSVEKLIEAVGFDFREDLGATNEQHN